MPSLECLVLIRQSRYADTDVSCWKMKKIIREILNGIGNAQNEWVQHAVILDSWINGLGEDI
jgi:hypothetical protein